MAGKKRSMIEKKLSNVDMTHKRNNATIMEVQETYLQKNPEYSENYYLEVQ